ncbi:MAG: hypothetical protein Q9227_001838 [Pyrenula ochraceoflavens]
MEDVADTAIPILLLGDAGCDSPSQPALRDLDQPFPLTIRFSRDQSYTLELYDTASPTSYSLLSPSIIILCYDISSRASLHSVKDRWRKEATVHFQGRGNAESEKIPIMLLGLKRDLRGEAGDMIYPEEGHGMATELRCDRYAECSALTGELVREALEDASKMAVMTTKNEGGQSRGPACVIM